MQRSLFKKAAFCSQLRAFWQLPIFAVAEPGPGSQGRSQQLLQTSMFCNHSCVCNQVVSFGSHMLVWFGLVSHQQAEHIASKFWLLSYNQNSDILPNQRWQITRIIFAKAVFLSGNLFSCQTIAKSYPLQACSCHQNVKR